MDFFAGLGFEFYFALARHLVDFMGRTLTLLKAYKLFFFIYCTDNPWLVNTLNLISGRDAV